jgi:hypothetical protein
MIASSTAKFLSRSHALGNKVPVAVAASLSLFRAQNQQQEQHAQKFRFMSAAAAVVASSLVANNLNSNEPAACDAGKCPKCSDKFSKTAFFPPIAAYEKGMLKVSDIHTIAYSVYGNPKGKPVLVVHGGPGGGTVPGK